MSSTPKNSPLGYLPYALCALLLQNGCAIQGMSGSGPAQILAKITIAGGTVIEVPFTKNGPENTEDDQVRIEKASLQISSTKRHGAYEFVLQSKIGTIRSVAVDDVTDDSPVRIIEKLSPVGGGLWEGRSEPFPISETSVGWLYDRDNTIRVYRFTIDNGSAVKEVLYQASAYPAFVKQQILRNLSFQDRPQ